MKETILIAEDDADIRDLLRLYLESEGFSVIEACDGEEAMRKANSAAPDLAILDVMLPGQSGFVLCQKIRETHTYPIIMLTAKDAETDKITGLTLGADDYIVKPFEVEELVARVESVLRRAGRANVVLRAFGVELDPAAHTVSRDGRPVHLAPREFELLELLMRNRGLTLYREVLYERLWGDDEAFDTRPLDLCIARLRRKLGWKDEIRTVFRVGYRLEKEEDGP